MVDITVGVHQDSERNALQFNWQWGIYPKGFYNVDRGLIVERAAAVRSALQELVDGRRKKDTSAYDELLRAVAQKGHDLYDTLFFGQSAIDRAQAERLQEWMAKKADAHRDTLTFTVPSATHIPWGLIYEHPNADDRSVPIDPDGFWCMKHDVSTLYNLLQADGLEDPWQPDQLALLFGAQREVWEVARGLLHRKEKDRLQGLLEPITQPKFSITDLKNTWSQKKDKLPYSLLCFYCHASGRQLCIGEETLSHSLFAQMFARKEGYDMPPTLVLLAGCETAVGDLDLGFLGATSGPGYCGFIGTEVKVPDVFTLGFLSCFLDRLYAGGQSVAEVLRQLRIEHWPLGLVFSMCCARDLRVAERSAPMQAERPVRNLCDWQIASE